MFNIRIRILMNDFCLNQVKVLYVRNLTQDTSESVLKNFFEEHGKVERVKKLKDYAFVHFEDRDNAVKVNYLFLLQMYFGFVQ